jgi:excisionase family DNA binding protein
MRMILHGKRKRPATILSEDSVTQTAVGMVCEKIREALEKILEAEAGYQKGFTLPSAGDKRACVRPAAYTVEEFCEALRLSRGTFYNLIRRGEGPRLLRVGRKVLVSTDAMADFIRGGEALSSLQPTCGGEKA